MSGPDRPAGVLFDFGGVFVPSPFAVFQDVERAGGLPDGFVRAVNSRNPDTNAWAQLERGEVDVDRFCVLFEDEARELGHEIDARAVVQPLLGLVSTRSRAVPSMLAVTALCRTSGVRTALVTNNAVPLHRDGDAAWIVDTFDEVIESCVVGTRKPEEKIYRLALDALDLDAAQVVMLDDLGINLKPARALGMRTIKVLDPDAAAAELNALLT